MIGADGPVVVVTGVGGGVVGTNGGVGGEVYAGSGADDVVGEGPLVAVVETSV